MDFKEYQKKCLNTWGGDHQEIRAIDGIVGECFEIKSVFDSLVSESLSENLKKEIGDCLYYIAITCLLFDMDIDNVCRKDAITSSPLNECIDGLSDSMLILEHRKKYLRGDFDKPHFVLRLRGELACLYDILLSICILFNIKIEDVLESNIAKLADRKERGVIMGSGNNR